MFYLQEEQFHPVPVNRPANRPTLLSRADVDLRKERCFESGGHGHLKKDCPHCGQRRCYNCLKYGDHLARNCPEPPKQSTMRGQGKGGHGKKGTACGKPQLGASAGLSKNSSNFSNKGKKGGTANAASYKKTKTVPYRRNNCKIKKKAITKKEAPAN